MRPALLASLLLACASIAPRPVQVALFRGVYSTHFNGIPDQTAICAVISNRGRAPVSWVRLRMTAYSNLGRRPGRWRSRWLYRGRLLPGESRAVRFENPPSASQIEITADRAGSGTPPRHGRMLRRARECSEASLGREIQVRNAGREIRSAQVLPIVRRNHPEPDLLIALGD